MKKPLSKSIKTFYGIGDMGFSLMTSVELYLFPFFLTNIAQFALPMVALIGTITSTVDALLSPFYGVIISGTKPMKWGRSRSWMLIAPPVVIFLYMLQFTKFGIDSVASAIIIFGFISSHVVWNLAWVGNVSLIPTIANNPDERALLASRRATYTSLASVFFSYIGSPVAVYLGEVTGNKILGYTLLAGFMATLMCIGYWIVFKITYGYEDVAAEIADSPKAANKVSFGIMFKSMVQNPPLIALLCSDFFRYLTHFIMTAGAAYYFTYVAKNMSLFPVYLLVSGLCAVVGAYVSSHLSKALTTRTASLICLFGTACAYIICNFVGLNIIMFFIFVCIGRTFYGSTSATSVALYSDVSVYSEWRTGENASPFIMGLMNLSLKSSIILRSVIIPIALSTAGFVAGADPANASLALQTACLNVFLLYPGICVFIAGVILLLFYKLTRERTAEMQAEINARKASV